MSFDRDEYDRMLARRAQERARDQAPELRRIGQAAVAAERLTGEATWDYFLTIVQDALEQTDRAIAEIQERIAAVEVVGDALTAAKVRLVQLESRAEALRQVIEIPRRVMELGEAATERLSLVERAGAGDAG